MISNAWYMTANLDVTLPPMFLSYSNNASEASMIESEKPPEIFKAEEQVLKP